MLTVYFAQQVCKVCFHPHELFSCKNSQHSTSHNMQARREKKDKQPISHLSKKEFAQDESVEAGLPLRANTVVPTSSDASSVKSNVTRIENLYIKALIPEMVIMDKSQKELQNTIEYLENLKRLLLKLREQQYPELDELERSRAASIYDRINEDVALYTQFVDPSFVNLERILQESEADSISADQHRDMIDFGYDHAVHSVCFGRVRLSEHG